MPPLVDRQFWSGKKVFVTGHTGFKGSWLALWLHELGATVTGYALPPPTDPSFYELCRIHRFLTPIISEIRESDTLHNAIREASPEIVFHLAAQSLVRQSYRTPVETYAVNVMGTANLLESIRKIGGVRALVNVTSDKCYENREWVWGYRENEPLGGRDPYSSSKACSELITSAYRDSYFPAETFEEHGVGLASARAGNVIGGGDFSPERLVPDCFRALMAGEKIRLRKPEAVRPWQHVLEPLCGYLLLAQKLWESGPKYVGAWNFGPSDDDVRPVEWVVRTICAKWGGTASYTVDSGVHPHEAHFLKLDSSKARGALGWRPQWNIEQAIDATLEWTMAFLEKKDPVEVARNQISRYASG